jgi:hypothetical protein
MVKMIKTCVEHGGAQVHSSSDMLRPVVDFTVKNVLSLNCNCGHSVTLFLSLICYPSPPFSSLIIFCVIKFRTVLSRL